MPRTLTGKVLEVPIKKLLMGRDPDEVVSRDALANPAAFDWFVDYAQDVPVRPPVSERLRRPAYAGWRAPPSCSRRTCLRIFPDGFRGIAATSTTWWGTLYALR